MTPGTRVFVYFNARRRTFSIRASVGPNRGKVIGHADVVVLLQAEFRVSEAGRQRMIAAGRKNVHAGVHGTLDYHGPNTQPHAPGATLFNYFPLDAPTFLTIPDRMPICFAARVILGTHACYAEGAMVCDCGGFVQHGAYVHADTCRAATA